MKKRMLCLALGLALCLGLGPVGAAESAGFSDVKEDDWFAPYVRVCVEHGLMNGTGDGMFSPSGILTEAECSTLALRLFMLPRGGDGTFETAPEEWGYFSLSTADGKTLGGYADRSDLWYYSAHKYAATLPAVRLETEEQRAWAPGLDGTVANLTLDGRPIPGTMRYRAKNPGEGHDLCFDPDDPRLAHSLVSAIWSRPGPDKWWRNAAYTAQLWELEGLTFSSQSTDRSFFVQTLALAVEELEPINSITALPDTNSANVLAFYNGGILTGVDEYGTFGGDRTLTRAEAAAMLARVLEPSLRLTFTLARPEAGKPQGYTLTEVPLPEGWTPTGDSNNVAAGWAAIARTENGQVTEEAIYRADGKILDLDGYFVYGFEHLTSRGSAVRLPVLTYGGAPKDEMDSHNGTLWNFYDVEEERFLLDGAAPEGDPAWTAAWEAYQSSPPTWPQVKKDESSGLCGYVDQTGNWVIPPQYDMASPFSDGAAVVHLRDGDVTATAIDETGRELLPRRYSELWYLGDGVFSYWGDLSYGADDDRRSDCGTVTLDGVETPTSAFSGYINGGLSAHHGLIAVGHEGDGIWAMAYYDYTGNQVSQDFDWAGPIGEDGAGFVCKDGGLFRIQFER